VTFRRRKSFRRPVRLRRNGTWVVAASADCGLDIEDVDCGQVATGIGQSFEYVFKLSPFSAGQAGEDNPATVVRMVGDQHVICRAFINNGANTDFGSVHIVEMWYIADIDSTGAIVAKDPTNATDIKSGDVMHMRSTLVKVGPAVGGQILFSMATDRQHEGSHIDFRVKRKLKEEEEIVYTIAVVTDVIVGAGTMVADTQVYGNIRAYVLC